MNTKVRRTARKAARKLEHLSNPQSRRNLAVDLDWRLRPAPYTPTPPTWPLDERRLSEVTVRWPTVYHWGPSRGWLEPLRDRFARHLTVEHTDVPQPYPGIHLIEFQYRDRVAEVVIDYFDLPHVNEEAADRAELYFKWQHLRAGYGLDHVVPGGYIERRDELYRFLGHLRRLRAQQDFRYDVHGRFSTEFAAETRARAVGLLSEQQRFRYEGEMQLVLIGQFLREVAHSKVCVDMPGMGPFCFRLVDYLAVGSCVVSPRHETVLHVPLVDGEHIAYCEPDLSDLVERCGYYVDHPDERERLAQASAEHFDRYLHWDQLTGYYLHTLLERLVR